MGRLPPKVIAATTVVAVVPAVAVWGLRAAGIVGAFLPCAALGALLSLLACSVTARLWERSARAGDVLFGDLMIWGWIRRGYQQRRIADAASLLGVHRVDGAADPLSLSIERRTQVLERLASDLEARDPYTHGHSRRVARYATMIAKRIGAGGEELARIRIAAALHDVGKLETPTAVLHKPGRLTESEFAIVKEHPVTGAQMVSILEDPELESIVRHHHERLDGTGYPDRLAGDRIPLGARIISVADTFDAITSARPYRAARPHREALKILRAEAGTQLDGDAVNAFCSVYSGRRPLSAWVAFTDLGERLLAWFVPETLGSTARVAALAASAAAVGGGVAALPAAGRSAARDSHTAALARTPGSGATRGAESVVAAHATVSRAPAAASGSHRRAMARARRGASSTTFAGLSRRGAGVHRLTGTPASAPVTSGHTGGSSSGTGSSAAAGDNSGGSGSTTTTVRAPVSTPAPVPTPSVGVTAGSSGPGSVSVGVTANTGTGTGVSAGATVGGSGTGVQVTLPGLGTIKVGGG